MAGMTVALALALAIPLAGVTASAGDPQFVDTAMAGVVLGDRQTSAEFVREHGGSEADGGAGLGIWRYANETQTEILEFYRHPGGVAADFMEFQVRAAAAATGAPAQRTRLGAFQSGKGIRLGLSAADVMKRLGPPLEHRQGNTVLVLSYGCSSPQVCSALTAVNMPEYRSEYRFTDDALVAFKAGYPYP